MDITEMVINKLKKANLHIALFFDTHFELVTEESLVPKFVENKIQFPTKSVLRSKDLTVKEKIAYYLEDLELFLKERKDESD